MNGVWSIRGGGNSASREVYAKEKLKDIIEKIGSLPLEVKREHKSKRTRCRTDAITGIALVGVRWLHRAHLSLAQNTCRGIAVKHRQEYYCRQLVVRGQDILPSGGFLPTVSPDKDRYAFVLGGRRVEGDQRLPSINLS